MPTKRKPRRSQDGLFERPDSPYYWVSFIDASGQRVRSSTGIRKSAEGRKEAEALLARWRLEAHQERQWGREPERTFDELMVGWLQENSRNRNAANDISTTRTLRKFFTGVVLNTMGAAKVNQYITTRREAGISDSRIRRELALFSAAINYARRQWEWQIPNPIEGRKPAQGEGRIRWITREEAEKLLAASANSKRALHLPDFIRLGLFTGMRSQEMLGLTWDRVDMPNRLLYLPASVNKGKRNVSVPLNETAYRTIVARAAFRATHCPGSPWVFCDKDGERIGSVRKGFRSACNRAGIVDFTPHDLRHTCAAWLVQAGVPLLQVRDLLRHTSVQVTEKYAHLGPKDVRSAVAVLDGSHDRVTLGKNKAITLPATP